MKSDDLRSALSGRVDDYALRLMMEGLFAIPHVAMWVKDADLRYVYVTPAWERSAGLRQEAVIGRRDHDFRSTVIADRFAEVDRRILASGQAETREERVATAYGVRAYTTTKFPLRDRDGAVFAIAGISTETTDQRTLPASSRTDARMLAAVLESMPDAIVRFTGDFRVTFANPSFVAIYAGAEGDLAGADLAALFGPALLRRFREAVAGLTEERPEAVLEQEWTRYDGRPRWRQWRLAAAFGADGLPVEIQATGGDVTDQKLYQTALEALLSATRKAHAPFAAVADEVLDIALDYLDLDVAAVVRTGGEGPEVERVRTRRGPAPPRSRHLDLLGSLPLGEDRPTLQPDARAGGGVDPRLGAYAVQPLELPGGRGAVVLHAAAARALPFPVQAADVLKLVAQWLSMAFERDRHLAELTRSRSELSLVLENVPAQVMTVGRDGRQLLANAAARAAGRPPESREADLVALAEGRGGSTLESWPADDGDVRWMRTERIPFHDAPSGEPRLLVVADDLTGLVEKERALAAANEGLAQFAYVASHDLQEPLRKIGTFVDILLAGLEAGNADDVDYASRVIRDSARRASLLIRDLLAWSRLANQPVERRPLRLDDLVRQVVEDVLAARPDESIEIVDEMTSLWVAADPTKARQLVENLVVNAVKYRHPGRPARIVLAAAHGPARQAWFEVRDNGIGFDQAYAGQIFEPFRRLHSEKEYTGTGVGLAICARVCEQHGWTIQAEGRPGEGATFRVDMTLAADDAAA